MLNRRGDPVRLIIVGDGPERTSLEAKIHSSGRASEIQLLGFRPDTSRIYGIFDLFVLNSHAEGMSNTILEAMASGLPVICTRVGGNTELVADEITGKHVPPGNAAKLAEKIREYVEEPVLRGIHGRQGRARVEKDYSLNVMIERYVQLYESCRPFRGAASHHALRPCGNP